MSEGQKAIISERQIGRKHSQESKLKRSIALKGKPLKEETKAKMRKPKSVKVIQSQDHVEKRGLKNTGLVRSEETKKKLSEAGKIAQNRPEVIAKKSASLTGRKLSDETKAKMSEAGKEKNKGRKQTAEHIAKRVEIKANNLKIRKNENVI